ncbi:MAG: enoyl-CoA hydratase-related protein [Bdellovibrionota bacterium]
MPDDDKLLVSRSSSIVTITLNDPPRNPIGMAMIDRLETLLPELDQDKEVRAVIFTGAGEKSFSSGGNIKEFAAGISKMTLEGFLAQRLKVLSLVENLSKPAIAAIRGTCLGGGLELALCCHFRIVAEDAELGLPEIELGVIPAWGGTQRLPRAIGVQRSLEMMLRNKKISGAEAVKIGLANESCAPNQVLPQATALAGELSEKPPLAVAAILKAVIQGMDRPFQQGLALELEGIRKTSGSKDNLEGISAFLQKRKPRFRGE